MSAAFHSHIGKENQPKNERATRESKKEKNLIKTYGAFVYGFFTFCIARSFFDQFSHVIWL